MVLARRYCPPVVSRDSSPVTRDPSDERRSYAGLAPGPAGRKTFSVSNSRFLCPRPSRVAVAPACLPDFQTLILDRLAHKPKQTHSGQYHRYREQYYYPPQLVVTSIDCSFGFHLLFLFAFVVKRCNLIFTKSIVVNVNVIYQAVPITSCIF